MNYEYCVYEKEINEKNFVGFVSAKLNDDLKSIVSEKFPNAKNLLIRHASYADANNIRELAFFFRKIEYFANLLKSLEKCLDLEFWKKEKIEKNKDYKVAYEVKFAKDDDFVLVFEHAKHEREVMRKVSKMVCNSNRKNLVCIAYNLQEANNRKEELKEKIVEYNNKYNKLIEKIKAE